MVVGDDVSVLTYDDARASAHDRLGFLLPVLRAEEEVEKWVVGAIGLRLAFLHYFYVDNPVDGLFGCGGEIGRWH